MVGGGVREGVLKRGRGGRGVGGTLQLYIYNTEVNIVTTM